MTQNNFYFWALEPEKSFYDLVLKKKGSIAQAIGEQPYCEDLPHTTLYLSAFSNELMLQEKTKKAAITIKSIINVETNGWHVFYADPLTGNNTLVIDLMRESVNKLIKIQKLIVNDLHEDRNRELSLSRYSPMFNDFDKTKRHNAITYGFPYIGNIWHPHITIASISVDLWEIAWKILYDSKIPNSFSYSTLALYRLEGLLPILVQSFDLSPENYE
jgi:hypothetical protein